MELSGKKVAILCTDGFEEVELTSPRKALQDAGAECHIISPVDGEGKTIKSWDGKDWGRDFKVDVPLKNAKAENYNALLLPGGVINPDQLRMDKTAISFIREFFKAKKPVAAICHGPQLLIEADVVEGRTLTSYPSIRTDLKNAGANVVDKEVVVDQGLVTSRSPKDLDAFNRKLVEEVGEGKHEKQAQSV